MSTCSMAGAPFLFTPLESGLGGLTLGLLAFAKLQITGRCGAVPSTCRSVVGGLEACTRLRGAAFSRGRLRVHNRWRARCLLGRSWHG